jgi:hypothetical protein
MQMACQEEFSHKEPFSEVESLRHITRFIYKWTAQSSQPCAAISHKKHAASPNKGLHEEICSRGDHAGHAASKSLQILAGQSDRCDESRNLRRLTQSQIAPPSHKWTTNPSTFLLKQQPLKISASMFCLMFFGTRFAFTPAGETHPSVQSRSVLC